MEKNCSYLIDIIEKYEVYMSSIFDKVENKMKCQQFTPSEKVCKMLEIAGYESGVVGKTVLETSCGCGNIMYEIVEKYIIDGITQGYDKKSISDLLNRDVYGIELDKILYEQCIKRLDELAEKYELPKVHWSLYNVDFLKWENQIEFDFVIGNPPYINYRDIDEDNRKWLRDNFISCRNGKFDYYYSFVEKGIKLLSPKGKMVQLVPSNIYKNVFAEQLRNILREKISIILDFPEEKIFENALTTSTIFLFDKGYDSCEVYYKDCTNGKTMYLNRKLLTNKWIFTDNEIVSNRKQTRKFGDVFNASVSIATLYNKAYLLDNDEILVEEELIKKAASPRGLRCKRNEFIIFPYFYENNKLERISVEEFEKKYTLTKKHLLKFYENLKKRNSDKGSSWFEYGRSQALAHLNQEKLLLSTVVTKRVEVYELDRDTIPYSGIYVTVKDKTKYKLKDALKILRSSKFLKYVSEIGINVSGKSKRITCKDINNYEFLEEWLWKH